MHQCPYPGCTHVAAHIILNSHAKQHGFKNMTELQKKYGRPKLKSPTNQVIRWASDVSTPIGKHHFEGVEAGISRLKQDEKKSR